MHSTLLLLIVILPQNGSANGPLDTLVNNALIVSLSHLESSVNEVRDTTLFPTYGTSTLEWKLKGSGEWTSGFYPGCLWYAYTLSNDPRFQHWARGWTASLEQEKLNKKTHDLGFKFMCTYGNGLRFGNVSDSSAYKAIMLTAAQTLAARYSPMVGCLESNWDKVVTENSFPVVIDIMMNLELLFWAARNGGPSYFAEYARHHAAVTCRDFVRPDGGTYHVVRYDKKTGTVLNKGTLQGLGDESTWARGQAWAQYGMVVAYRYTKEKRFLDMAVRLADYFIDRLPEDHVSPWDFQSDLKYRDVSATCVVASGLLEMVRYIENDSLKGHYQKEAEAMLTSLCGPPYFTGSLKTNCLLDHSVHYFSINSNVDVPAIFADYYFLEALQRFTSRRP